MKLAQTIYVMFFFPYVQNLHLRHTIHPNPPPSCLLLLQLVAVARAGRGLLCVLVCVKMCVCVRLCTTAYSSTFPSSKAQSCSRARHGSPRGPSRCLIPRPNHRMTHMEMSGGHKPKLSQGNGFRGREAEGITLTQSSEVHLRAWNNKPRPVKWAWWSDWTCLAASIFNREVI